MGFHICLTENSMSRWGSTISYHNEAITSQSLVSPADDRGESEREGDFKLEATKPEYGANDLLSQRHD